MPIKYLGSKRRLIPQLGQMLEQSGATSALDLFTGTTRVAQAFKQRGAHVTAVDIARYSEVFAQCYIAADSTQVDKDELREALDHLGSLPGREGYFTATFCQKSRFFKPENGRRIDAIREELETTFSSSPLYPILLTSLIEAADRVDSTTGVQMAYLKSWAPRAHNDLELRIPDLLPGSGTAVRARAEDNTDQLGHFDVAYLDPPYNQHRYFTNYHIWETLVAWDKPEAYGVACKRIDCRDEATKSVFNKKREMPDALKKTIASVQADLVILSYNNESWITLEDLVSACSVHGEVSVLAFDSKRYVGAQIGIFNPQGDKVGRVSHLTNVEYVLVAGEHERVAATVHGVAQPAQDALF
jgi:adenine-specific DNA-methyltransferase